jgi:AcrR family transcriptional regulator
MPQRSLSEASAPGHSEARTARRSEVSAAKRRGRPGYDQQSVLKVATDVFNKHGYEATSMGVLADNLGISKSAIYHHVPSKADLLRLALNRALDGLEAILSETGAIEGPAGQRLEYVLRRTVGVMVEELPYVTLLLRVRGNTEMERVAMTRRRAFNARVTKLVKAASAEGSMRTDIDPQITSRLLFGTINSIVDWYRPGGAVTTQKLADGFILMVFDGLVAPSGPGRG